VPTGSEHISVERHEAVAEMVRITFIGIGNTLAGDDGVGIFMLRELERRLASTRGMKFLEIPGDLYAVWDILPDTESVVFLDAVAGEKPGMIKTGRTMSRALSPSFHQADLCSVLDSLEAVYEGVFPQWTLWGVTVDPPQTLGEGLTQEVAGAVEETVFRLITLLEGDGLQVGNTTVKTEHQVTESSTGKPG